MTISFHILQLFNHNTCLYNFLILVQMHFILLSILKSFYSFIKIYFLKNLFLIIFSFILIFGFLKNLIKNLHWIRFKFIFSFVTQNYYTFPALISNLNYFLNPKIPFRLFLNYLPCQNRFQKFHLQFDFMIKWTF